MRLFDVLGPVMIGPSSSHTAGAARIGYTAQKLLGDVPAEADIGLYGSFATTGRGPGTDRALVAGLLGMLPDDERIPDSFSLAQQAGLDYTIGTVVLRDRKHLAEDGMVVVVLPISAHDGYMLAEPEIITRGFIYVKESEDLMDELKEVAMEAIDRCQRKRVRDWSAIKSAIMNDLSGYLYKTTKRNPMVIPVVTRL